jgi:hypothetical protein
MADKQIELELEPTEEEIVIVEEPEKDEEVAAEPQLSVEDGINELKFKLEEERKAREAAERRAKEATEMAALAKNETADTHLRLYETAIDTVKRNTEIMKANLRDAMAIGDYDTVSQIQSDMIKADNDLRILAHERNNREAEIKNRPRNVNPVEELASQLTPRSAEWVRAHPETVLDPMKQRKLRRAHEDAIDDGIAPDTDAYFNFIESRIGSAPRQQQESALSEASSAHSGRRAAPDAAPPAAPVSRSGTGTGSSPNRVTLSRAEQEAARDMGMSLKDYANNKASLIKSGRMNG